MHFLELQAPTLFQHEASCSQAVQTAKNIVADIGVNAAAKSSGLVKFSKSRLGNAERDAHRQFQSRNLRLPIPLAAVGEDDSSTKQPGLRLKDWGSFLLRRNLWHLVTGLQNPDKEREAHIWQDFWSKFEEHHPEHNIFSLARQGVVNLSRTCALAFHGDEGRGRKKQAFFVCNWYSLLGRGVEAARRMQQQQKIKQKYLKQKVNYMGHVYCSRFLCGVLPKHLYKEKETALSNLFRFAATETQAALQEGFIDSQGVKYHFACVAVTGDWPFLQKCGSLERTFSTLPKKLPTSDAAPVCKGICHLCLAGRGPYPFENLVSSEPSWLSTLYQESPFREIPAFATVAHTPGELEALFRFDIWHSFHLGVGKNFLGSAIAMATDYFPGNTIDERFHNMSLCVNDWCRLHGEHLYINQLTKDMINWPTRKDYPTGGWSKGSTTTVLLRWFVSWSAGVNSDDILFIKVKEAAQFIDQAFTLLYHNDDVWLESNLAKRIGQMGVNFLKRYAECALISNHRGMCLFILMPKLHSLQHIFLLDLLHGASKHSHCLHPLCFGAQMSEDFIGRTSRLARRTHPKTVMTRVTLRYLTKALQEYVNEGYLQN